MRNVIPVLVLALALLLGCGGEPKIDTSTDGKMKISIEKVRISLPENKRNKFDEAMKVLLFSSIDIKNIFSQNVSGIDLENKAKATIEGKTGNEIINLAEKILVERREKEREQAVKEIEKLEKEKSEYENALAELSKFEIRKSRFYKKKDSLGMSNPIIELKIFNGTNTAISRVYFAGTLASPNRSVPWLQKDFNYKISGGIEPKEEKHWKLAPNAFSDWGTVDAPNDAILTVRVVRLDGPDGEKLFSIIDFDNEKKERLKILKSKFS